MSGTFGLALYTYMAGLDTSSLDLKQPTDELVVCLDRWPQRYDKALWSSLQGTLQLQLPKSTEEYVELHRCPVPLHNATACRDVRLRTTDMAQPLALAMGTSTANVDLLGLWAFLFLFLTFVIWVGITVHDLALIGQTQKDFVLDVTGVNDHCPSIRRVWKSLAGHRFLKRLASADDLVARALGTALALCLAPLFIAWNLVLFLFVMCPLIALTFLRYPIRMSRAWVFIISVTCSVYGLALSFQQIAYVSNSELRPRYALTWEEPIGDATDSADADRSCICGCDYAISFSVCWNLLVIGALTTLKSVFLALRCLKGLRRSQWASLLSVQFPIPLTVYSVNWKQPDDQPIRFRTEDMPVQGEVAFDPFAMMDEQPDSAYTTVHLKPEPVHQYRRTTDGLMLIQPHRKLETPALPLPHAVSGAGLKQVESEYIGCCGFPWPTGGHQCVYDDDFLASLEERGMEAADPDDADKFTEIWCAVQETVEADGVSRATSTPTMWNLEVVPVGKLDAAWPVDGCRRPLGGPAPGNHMCAQPRDHSPPRF